MLSSIANQRTFTRFDSSVHYRVTRAPVVLPTRSARRVPPPHREYSSEPVSSPRRVVCARRVGERPVGRGTEGAVARSGVSFFLVTFSWTSKKKPPAVGQPPTSKTRLKAARQWQLPGLRCASSGLPIGLVGVAHPTFTNPHFFSLRPLRLCVENSYNSHFSAASALS